MRKNGKGITAGVKNGGTTIELSDRRGDLASLAMEGMVLGLEETPQVSPGHGFAGERALVAAPQGASEEVFPSFRRQGPIRTVLEFEITPQGVLKGVDRVMLGDEMAGMYIVLR